MNNFDLIDKIKKIVETKEPNKIKSIIAELPTETNYNNLLKFWKETEKNNPSSKNEIYLEYKNLIDFKNKNLGIFSLFYIKNCKNFLTVAKKDDGIYYFDIKCNQYQNVLSNAMTSQDEVFVLTYWIV